MIYLICGIFFTWIAYVVAILCVMKMSKGN
jgi:hypothetical protein